ncbi:MAG: glycosyltransferase family 4 protein, partial [Proteobacteria bacterium]|nr:glycosyltransferase family 4 protein [Pseudomonadota bacterium]
LRLLVTAAKFDLVFIQRKLFSSMFIRLLRKVASRIVFDFDDAINLRSNGEISRTRANKFEAVIKAADLVLAGNSYLAESASALGARVEISPTSVDVDRYLSQIPRLEKISLVWIGSRSTSRYLESHRSILEALGKKIPGIKLRIIGDFELSLDHLEVENVPWTDSGEVDAIAQCHIGIAPMDDDNWTRGKCALKVIQYMAAGLPVVSSAVGANKDVIEHGETGFLAEDQDAWLEAVGKLVNSRQLREQMGESARMRAKERYSSDAITRQSLSSLDQLLLAR